MVVSCLYLPASFFQSLQKCWPHSDKDAEWWSAATQYLWTAPVPVRLHANQLLTRSHIFLYVHRVLIMKHWHMSPEVVTSEEWIPIFLIWYGIYWFVLLLLEFEDLTSLREILDFLSYNVSTFFFFSVIAACEEYFCYNVPVFCTHVVMYKYGRHEPGKICLLLRFQMWTYQFKTNIAASVAFIQVHSSCSSNTTTTMTMRQW